MPPKRKAAITASLAITENAKRSKDAKSSAAVEPKQATKAKPRRARKHKESYNEETDDKVETVTKKRTKKDETSKGNDEEAEKLESPDDEDDKEPKTTKGKAERSKAAKKNGKKAVDSRGKNKKTETSDQDEEEPEKSQENDKKPETFDEEVVNEVKTSKGKGKKPRIARGKGKRVVTARGNGKKPETSEDEEEERIILKSKDPESSDDEDVEEQKAAKERAKKPLTSRRKGKKPDTSSEDEEEPIPSKSKDDKPESSDDEDVEEPKAAKERVKKPLTSRRKGKKVESSGEEPTTSNGKSKKRLTAKGKAKKLITSDEDEESESGPTSVNLASDSNGTIKKEKTSGKVDDLESEASGDSDTDPKTNGKEGNLDTVTPKEENEELRKVRYEFEESPDKWVVYDEDSLDDIEQGFDNKKKSVSVVVDGEMAIFSFSDLKQVYKNKRTKSDARVRCSFLDGKSYFTWSFEESGTVTYLNQETSSLLEEGLAAGSKTVSIKMKRASQTVDLQAMVVIVKRSSKVTKVLRTKSEAKAATKSTPSDLKKVSSSKDQAKVAQTEQIRTVLLKGKAPVDPHCVEKVGIAKVYYEGDEIWDAMLNQTNLQFNNNKFYQLQLLEDDSIRRFSVWLRWGRVGNKGQSNLIDCGQDLEEAKETFMRKFYDKTQNRWSDRESFVKVQGKYDLVAMDYAKPTDLEESGDKVPKTLPKIPECKLDHRLKDLIELIYNVKAMEEAVVEMKYDAKKSPLGKLTTDQISAGYSALKEIDELITKGITGTKLLQACNNFYTKIPHSFGMKVPPLISTKADVLEKIHLLEALGDIQLAMKLLSKVVNDFTNPIDSHYEALKCDLKPLERDTDTFNMIEKYLQDTHQVTHSMYEMEILDIFECSKEKEIETFHDVGNRMLLWHGSRLTNWAGILSRGLCIAPPEAPVSGYMFGKGVYFADRSSKSANYCFTTKKNNIGIFVLCEVALGNIEELVAANNNANVLAKNKNSVKGLGMLVPDSSNNVTLSDGTVVPIGKSVQYQGNQQHLSLQYNEYVVYDTRQIKLRYLLKVKFNYA